jgi:hypothetical protein
VVKVEVEVSDQAESKVDLSIGITGGKFEFIDDVDGKCVINNQLKQLKSVTVPANGRLIENFYFKLKDEGEYELKVDAKDGKETDQVSKKIKTFMETAPKDKVLVERGKQHGSYYATPSIDQDAYKTIFKISGDLFVNLKYAKKLM